MSPLSSDNFVKIYVPISLQIITYELNKFFEQSEKKFIRMIYLGYDVLAILVGEIRVLEYDTNTRSDHARD